MIRRRVSSSLVLVACLVSVLLSGCARDTTKITVVFDDAGDLQPRGSLQTADVRIGRIGSIQLTKDFKARVTLHINSGREIPRNSAAILRTTSLLGEKFVELRPLGDPTKGPFLRDGDVVTNVQEAPELEFIAEEAVNVLGAVTAGDVASIIDTSATSFTGRKEDLRTLIASLDSYSAALASRASGIGRIVDNLDVAMTAFAGGADDLSAVLGDFATTTQVLAENRDKAVSTLRNLSRLAAVQNDVFDDYRSNIERQIRQIDGIVKIVAGQTTEVKSLIDWLDRFVTALPGIIPNDFTNVFGWVVPGELDPRVGT